MAEREGFEPSKRGLAVYTLSRRAPSTARTSLHFRHSPGSPESGSPQRARDHSRAAGGGSRALSVVAGTRARGHGARGTGHGARGTGHGARERLRGFELLWVQICPDASDPSLQATCHGPTLHTCHEPAPQVAQLRRASNRIVCQGYSRRRPRQDLPGAARLHSRECGWRL